MDISNSEKNFSPWDLNRDICVYENLSCIFDGVRTGIDDSEVSDMRWEIALYEGRDAYYAKSILIQQDSDDVYVAAKIPKKNVSGDPRTDENFRWDMLWAITYATGRTYDYNPYITKPFVQRINGHTVRFGNCCVCDDEHFMVISDLDLNW